MANAMTCPLPRIRSSLGTLLWQLCLDTGPQLLTVKNVSDSERDTVMAGVRPINGTRRTS